ncbi:S-layer homology domain-containing protein [Lysinibacillus pakistanensis]|uniref:S-layer homology domain-containing protein n=1 Tax=Lysinibacillus pakistanensis TaxID=759811 RepID=UPI003D2DC7B6
MKATKRQQGWKRILNTFLAMILVASTVSFVGVPQQAQAASASPELIVDYEFTDQGSGNILPADKKGNSTLTEVSGTHNNNTYGNTTTAYGSDSTGPYWQWTTNTQRGGGFTLDIDPAKVAEGIDKSYTISVRFSYDMFNSTWTKIIDYKNKTLDTGFYFAGKNKLKFYNIGTDGITSAAPKSIIDIIATRDESTKKFTAYMMVDGVFEKEIEVDDIAGEATPSIVDGKIRFGFFHDDYRSSGLEKTTGGKVYSVKFWDGAITPAEILTATASKGTDPGTTKVDVAPSKSSGTSLKMVVSDKILSFPFPGEAIPTGAQPYTSDADIAGVDATTNKYVGIYEIDDLTGEIVGFRLITLAADQIKADTVYKEPLQAEVDKESTLTEAHYTTSSWNDYQLKLTAAKSVLADVDASQKDVDDALAALNVAKENLKRLVTGAAITTSPGDTLAVVVNNSIEDGNVVVDAGVTLDSTVLAGYESNLNGASVAIENFKAGDTLTFTPESGITGNFNANTGILTLSGTASIVDYQAVLRSVKFATTSTDRTERNITFTLGSALAYSENGHFYEYINKNAVITWHNAKKEAEEKNYFGRQGYLVTITDQDESAFVTNKTQGLGWIGAQDIERKNGQAKQTGDWRWVTGPEGLNENGEGMQFYTGYATSGGSTVTGMYDNWAPNEPNNYGNAEYVAHIFGPGATAGKWNDYSPTNNTVNGYVIEYGGMPGDEKFALSASKKIVFVDKTALNNKKIEITNENLNPTDYTPESWNGLQKALSEANTILTNPTATQAEVDAALATLTNVKDNLVHVKPKPETAVLEQTAGANKVAVTFDKNIQVTDLAGFAITVDGTEVTPTGFEVVGDKLVLTFPNNPDVTDKAVKVKYDGTGNLQGTNGAAIEQFELPVEDPYSAAFQITKPDAVTANPQPTIGGKVDVTTTPSTVTIVLKNDKDEPVLVDVAAIVDPTTGEWTFTPPTDLPDGTYTIIATATNGQQTVTKKHTFTVATTPIVNKVPLQQKVEEAKNLVAGEYTPASWSNYQTALNKAKEILANPNATQEEVDKALAALTGAQNALVKIGKGLGTLTPSTGTLSPSFQTGVTDYTMTVGYSTSVIDFTAIPVEAGATVTTTVNGQPGSIGQIPLQVGENIIVISVKDANGNVRQYTIKVYRDAYTGGGSWTPNPTPPVTPTLGDTKTKIQVELEIDGEKPLEKTTVEIERTKHANGDITDFVALTEANAKEAVAKAKEIGNNIARIVLPDVNDEVKEAKVEIPKESLKLLRDNGLSLEISSENGHITIPVSSMEGIDDNFYFRLVPVKKESERQAIEERARAERVVRETLQSNDVHVVARPMTIETNMPSRPVQVTLPLKGVKIPTDAKEREAFLKQLAVFIEHSDGEKKVVIPEVVTMAKGELGLRFTVEKFSTFTIIQVNKKEETKPPLEVKEHEAYIKGFQDGTFGPEKNVTRAQVATMIARILGYTDGPVNTAPFKDIPSDHYAAGAIAFVKERGIMNGDVNGNFRASENITRAQMATVVANFKQLSIEENVANTFNDTKDHWAQWIIEANRAAGIINGRQDGSFAPDEHLTRAQAVVMMNRMFERGPLQGVTAPSFPDVKATHWAFDDIEEAAKSHAYFIDEDGDEQLSK